ncbi:glutamate--tRNA ligase [Algicella marina]|uniref:Glutamate--tRNA ligase n=1 Tax=Algicella marina TaxID=2683284 RepID=A0A6P1T151_9RHOB|nr:glutamate--tRNA ligase [Algicella marina]QHQ35485.1 glutamate--tRNA ligase [Algicella marina]
MTTTRFAPSPTGYLHVGNLRTALFNWLIARKAGGTFILRIDDTDAARSEEHYVDAIREDLEWLGLTWDRVERQSARLGAYEAAAEKLRSDGRLYEAFETPTELDLKRKKQLNMGRPPVYDRSALTLSDADKEQLRESRDGHWRFLLERERIAWNDGILGPQSIDAASVSDPVLIRGDGQMLYTLASVVDDVEMGVTDVVRGSDHVTNTATQIQIIAALGGSAPVFAHHSLLTGPQGEALSKRLGTLALRDLRDQGIAPMAVLSLMARLGSSQPVELREHIGEVIDGFDLSHFGAAPTKFDVEDLRPLTARILHGRSYGDVAGELEAIGVPETLAEAFWLAIRENIERMADAAEWWALCRDGAEPIVEAEDEEFVAKALAALPPRPWDEGTWGAWTSGLKDSTGRKGRALFMPLRKALTGRAHGPDMSALMPLLQVVKAPE